MNQSSPSATEVVVDQPAPARTGVDQLKHRRTQTGRAALVFGVLTLLLGITTPIALGAGAIAVIFLGAWGYFCLKTDYFRERAFWWSVAKGAAILVVLDLLRSATSI